MLRGYETDGNGFAESNRNILLVPTPREDEVRRTYSFINMWPHVESLVKSVHNGTVTQFFHNNRSNPLVLSPSVLRESIRIMCQCGQAVDRVNMCRAVGDMVLLRMEDIKAEIDRIDWCKLAPTSALVHIRKIWALHCDEMNTINDWLSDLDDDPRFLLENSLLSISDLGIQSFRDFVFSTCANFRLACNSALLTLVKQRRLNILDQSNTMMKEAIAMLKAIGQFGSIFGESFIRETEEFYSEEARVYITKLPSTDYIDHIQRRIKEERAQSDVYDDTPTLRSVIRIVVTSFVDDQLDSIVNEVMHNLMDQHQFDKLKTLFSYVDRNERVVERFKTSFSAYIKDRGSRLISQPDQDDMMIDRLLAFYEMTKRSAECFGSEERFVHPMNDAFSSFINIRPNKPAELIAKYIDSKLRMGHRDLSSREIEQALDRSLVLFRLISGKDVFEAFYKRNFARRLLTDTSSSVEAEKSMLSKLKQECGALFTHRLEGMLKDMETSKDLSNTFAQNKYFEVPFPMTVNVLTLSYWPNYPTLTLRVPDEMIKCQETFTDYYRSRHTGRRLQWQNSLSSCILTFRCQSKVTKELLVSLVQATILLLFNDHESLTISEVRTLTGLDNGTVLKRAIASLCSQRTPVLVSSDLRAIEEDSTVLSVNRHFKHRLFRIRVNQAMVKETPEENVAMVEAVHQDHQFHLDAAIVRIMKSKQTLSRQDLMQEVFSLLRFAVNANEVDSRLESLVQRDYISKSSDDPDIYVYVA